MHSKPLNYGKLADIKQEEKQAPGKFPDRLREGLRRFTEIDPESEEGKVILKDRFTLLSEIPERAKYFSVIDLKDAFYSVQLRGFLGITGYCRI